MFVPDSILILLGATIFVLIGTHLVFRNEHLREISDLRRDLRLKHGQYLEAMHEARLLRVLLDIEPAAEDTVFNQEHH